METLKNEKFCSLSKKEMKKVNGGAWRPVNYSVGQNELGTGCSTYVTYRRYILGFETNQYQIVERDDS